MLMCINAPSYAINKTYIEHKEIFTEFSISDMRHRKPYDEMLNLVRDVKYINLHHLQL